jgi:multimeric flavodoxin WrbA
MKTVILFGSPRRDGNTMKLTAAFTSRLKQRGHSVRMLYLNDMNIRPCQGCYSCLDNGACKINDDMKDIRKFIMESDLIVFATPLYWFGPSAQLKLAMDRSIAFMDEKYNSRIKGKKAVVLVTLGSDDKGACQPLLGMFKKTFDLLGLSQVGSIEAPGCGEKTGGVAKEVLESAERLADAV